MEEVMSEHQEEYRYVVDRCVKAEADADRRLNYLNTVLRYYQSGEEIPRVLARAIEKELADEDSAGGISHD